MPGKKIGGYGSWGSPITADSVATETVPLSEPRLDGDTIYWIELRAADNARYVLVSRSPGGAIGDVTPKGYSVRSLVHSYGGGAYEVRDGVVYFVNATDQQIYRQSPGAAPAKLTSQQTCRYADICVDAARGRLIAAQEQHPAAGAGPDDPAKVSNTLVAVDLANGVITTLDGGSDFCSSPALSPDGSKLAWLSWQHPNMPWVSTSLNLADLDAAGLPSGKRVIAGGADESVFQPQWSPENRLWFVSDRTDFWNLYRWNGTAAEAMLARDSEFGVPQWRFGASTYAFMSANLLVYSCIKDGMWRIGRLDVQLRQATDYPSAYSSVSWLRATAKSVVLRSSTADSAPAIGILDADSGAVTVVKDSLPPASYQPFKPYFSRPQPISFPSDGADTAYAFFYAPNNPDWQASAAEKPPLLVMSHGGPTAATDSGLNLGIQFWTSRGFAVADVNYRGSTGYGRKYRERLKGQWGIADVADCIACARHLASRGDVDRARLAITGGSAGGYTTLCALTFHRVFAAGASYYGISNLVALATDTHKFEMHYMDWLVEPYTPGNVTYHDRSPINYAQQLSAPVIFLHGEIDQVVPINQAMMMYDALRTQGISTCLFVFQNEDHGFRQALHIRQALEAELQFYAMNLVRAPLTS